MKGLTARCTIQPWPSTGSASATNRWPRQPAAMPASVIGMALLAYWRFSGCRVARSRAGFAPCQTFTVPRTPS